jgi:DNA topoisomerase-2
MVKSVQDIIKELTISNFAAEQFIQFSRYDCERSLPHVIDGMKTTQRKIIHTFIRENVTAPKELKVAQAASSVAFHTDYHHGEAGIMGVITGMAPDYVGSNNINLLDPLGMFGSQLDPTPSAGRYIFTRLSDSFRKIFKKDDDLILNHLYSDDLKIEPDHYLPLIPMILVNGPEGIGTGFACKFFNHNPIDIIDDILNTLNEKKRKPLVPYYKGFKGVIESGLIGQWIFKGVIEKVNTTTLKVTEFPIGMTQEKFKSILIKLKEDGIVKDFDDDSSADNGIMVTIDVPRTTGYLEIPELLEKFKLISRDTENLTAWLPHDKVKRFESTSDIVSYFVDYRLQKFEERRLKLVEAHTLDLIINEEKARFIEMYISNADKFAKKTKAELTDILINEKFTQIDKLLSIRIYNLTKDEIEKLKQEIVSIKATINELNSTSSKDLYIRELQQLKKELR